MASDGTTARQPSGGLNLNFEEEYGDQGRGMALLEMNNEEFERACRGDLREAAREASDKSLQPEDVRAIYRANYVAFWGVMPTASQGFQREVLKPLMERGGHPLDETPLPKGRLTQEFTDVLSATLWAYPSAKRGDLAWADEFLTAMSAEGISEEELRQGYRSMAVVIDRVVRRLPSWAQNRFFSPLAAYAAAHKVKIRKGGSRLGVRELERLKCWVDGTAPPNRQMRTRQSASDEVDQYEVAAEGDAAPSVSFTSPKGGVRASEDQEEEEVAAPSPFSPDRAGARAATNERLRLLLAEEQAQSRRAEEQAQVEAALARSLEELEQRRSARLVEQLEQARSERSGRRAQAMGRRATPTRAVVRSAARSEASRAASYRDATSSETDEWGVTVVSDDDDSRSNRGTSQGRRREDARERASARGRAREEDDEDLLVGLFEAAHRSMGKSVTGYVQLPNVLKHSSRDMHEAMTLAAMLDLLSPPSKGVDFCLTLPSNFKGAAVVGARRLLGLLVMKQYEDDPLAGSRMADLLADPRATLTALPLSDTMRKRLFRDHDRMFGQTSRTAGKGGGKAGGGRGAGGDAGAAAK